MKIYVYTLTKGQIGFTPSEVCTFISEEEAINHMAESISSLCNIALDRIKMMSTNNVPLTYYNGDVEIHKTYASDAHQEYYWSIRETEISAKDAIIGRVIEFLHKEYTFPASFDSIIYKLAFEYSEETLSKTNVEDFINEHLIGEALYENALAQLGGKTDEVSTSNIIKYLNEGFVLNECANQVPTYCEFGKEKPTNHNKWFVGMLMICQGNYDIIKSVRIAVDSMMGSNYKIFAKERLNDVLKLHSIDLPQNHRELCSHLSDEDYIGLVRMIFNHNYKFDNSNNQDLRIVAKNFFEEVKYVLYRVIRYYGYDELFKTYEHIMTLKSYNGEYEIAFYEDMLVIADMIEELKSKYDNLF